MGYKLKTIKSYCSKCAPRGNTQDGEYNLYVEDIQLGRYNEFECQVSPDYNNEHQALRARATLNVLGKLYLTFFAQYPYYSFIFSATCKIGTYQH